MLAIYSASAPLAYVKYDGASALFFKKQVLNLVVALVAAGICALVDYRFWERLVWPAAFVVLGLLIATLAFGVGNYAAAVRRWLRIGNFFLQPSELAKLTVVIILAKYVSARGRPHTVFDRWLPLAIVAAIFATIAAEPDFGMAFLVAVVAFVMLFLGGVRLRLLLSSAVTVVPLLALMVYSKQYRIGRLISYMDPWQHMRGRGYQIIQSLIALGSGGVFGKGLGASSQKLFYLPQPHTDFIFAVYGEELGLVGTLAVVGAFLILLTAGFRVAARAGDAFGRFLAAGLTTVIGLGAVVNLGVVTGLIPTTGIPLPFISYGGTSLVTSFAAVGVLVNIARHLGADSGFGYAKREPTVGPPSGAFVDYV